MATTPPLPPPYSAVDPALTGSEFLPFRSHKISIRKSRALVPLVLTGFTCVVLFGYLQAANQPSDLAAYMNVLATFVVSVIFLAIYVYSGEHKNPLWYLWPAFLTCAQMIFVFKYYEYLFRTLLPGNMKGDFLQTLVGSFFGAGMAEELLKAVPALIGLLIAWAFRAAHRRGNAFTRGFTVEGPIDAMLMGAAAGAGFTVIETMFQYVPNVIKAFQGNATGYLYGLSLLIPRVLMGVIGHMAWASIFGYFIGLCVNHRRSAIYLIPVGWVMAALLHGFWNSADKLHPTYGGYVSAAFTMLIYISCLMKARQLELSRLGRPVDGHSILALTPQVMMPAPIPIAGVGGAPQPAFPRLAIGTVEGRYALDPGGIIDFASLFPALGMPAGGSGLVEAVPGGSVSIRNTGTLTWTAATPDGAAWAIPPAASFPASAGTRIVLGAATVDVAPY